MLKRFLILLTDFDEADVNKHLRNPQLSELRDIIRTFGYQLDYAPNPDCNYEG